MNVKLKEVRERYKKGTMFLSATRNLKNPIRVSLVIVSENYPNTYINENGGVLYYEDEDGVAHWAEIVE